MPKNNTANHQGGFGGSAPDDDVAAIFVSRLKSITHKIHNDFYRKPIPMKLDMTR